MKRLKRHMRAGVSRVFLLAAILLLTQPAFADQNPYLDSLKQVVALGKEDTFTVQATKLLAFYLHFENVEEAISYARQSLALASKLNYERGIVSAYLTLGQCYIRAGELDSALEYCRIGGMRAQAIGMRKGVFNAFLNAGVAYDSKADFLNSVKMQLAARKIAETDGKWDDVVDCDYNLGITYAKMGNQVLALEYFTQAAESYKAEGDFKWYAEALDAIGNVYLDRKEYDSAQTYYQHSLDIASQLERGSSLAHKYGNMGGVYSLKGDYATAISYMEKAVKSAQETGQMGFVADNYNNLGSCYRRAGNLDLAIYYSTKALEMSKAMGKNETSMMALGNLVDTYVDKGDADHALDYYKELEDMKDSLQVDQAAAEVANMRVEYEADKNVQELRLLEEQKHAAEARAEKNMLWLVVAFSLAFALLMAFLVVALLLLSRKRHAELQLKQKNAEFAHKKLELEQRALRSQMNPHFIFNSLNAIQRLYIEGDLDRAGDYTSDFAQILRKILDHSRSDTIQLAGELETLRLYLRLEEARLDGVLEYEIDVDEDIDLYNTQLPPLVLQPFVENAIWHGILPAGGKGKVRIVLRSQEDNHILCTITDNGVGIDRSRSSKGNSLGHESKGMKITQERLGPSGEVLTQELPDGGTKITLKIPVTYG